MIGPDDHSYQLAVKHSTPDEQSTRQRPPLTVLQGKHAEVHRRRAPPHIIIRLDMDGVLGKLLQAVYVLVGFELPFHSLRDVYKPGGAIRLFVPYVVTLDNTVPVLQFGWLKKHGKYFLFLHLYLYYAKNSITVFLIGFTPR